MESWKWWSKFLKPLHFRSPVWLDRKLQHLILLGRRIASSGRDHLSSPEKGCRLAKTKRRENGAGRGTKRKRCTCLIPATISLSLIDDSSKCMFWLQYNFHTIVMMMKLYFCLWKDVVFFIGPFLISFIHEWYFPNCCFTILMFHVFICMMIRWSIMTVCDFRAFI